MCDEHVTIHGLRVASHLYARPRPIARTEGLPVQVAMKSPPAYARVSRGAELMTGATADRQSFSMGSFLPCSFCLAKNGIVRTCTKTWGKTDQGEDRHGSATPRATGRGTPISRLDFVAGIRTACGLSRRPLTSTSGFDHSPIAEGPLGGRSLARVLRVEFTDPLPRAAAE